MVVWITGASSGLGLATAQALREAGHTVIAGARSFRAETGADGIHRLPLDVEGVNPARGAHRLTEKQGIMSVAHGGVHHGIPRPDRAGENVPGEETGGFQFVIHRNSFQRVYSVQGHYTARGGEWKDAAGHCPRAGSVV